MQEKEEIDFMSETQNASEHQYASRQAILKSEGRKNWRIKSVFRWSADERLLRLFRVMWERQRVGITYSVKLSFGIARKIEDSWIGIYWKRSHLFDKETFVYFCLIPWFPIRVHYIRSYGGNYI
jgi:hypothetical protein